MRPSSPSLFAAAVVLAAASGAETPRPSGPQAATSATPSATFDKEGTLWVVWVDGSHVYVGSSKDLGRTFATSVRVNATPETIDANGEARPKIAAGASGEIYVSYTQKLAKPYTGHIRFARSIDGGRTFSPPSTVNDDGLETGHRFDALSVAPSGDVHLFWIDKRDVERAAARKEKYDGAALYHAVSTNRGQTFSANRKIKDHVCECCRLAVDWDGDVPVLFWRDLMPGGVRDHSVARVGAKDPVIQRATDDGWEIVGCPHHGPAFAIGAGGVQHLAWFTGEGVRGKGTFYRRSTDGGRTFSNPVRLGATHSTGRPQVLASGPSVWLVWKETAENEETAVYVAQSDDAGATWSPPREIARRTGASDHPQLVAHAGAAHLSWFGKDGYRLYPLAASSAAPPFGEPATPPPSVPASTDLPSVKALAILAQAARSIEEGVTTGELGQVHNEDMFLYPALGLLQKDARAAGKDHVVAALQNVARRVADVHESADAFDRAAATARLTPMARAFEKVFDDHDRGLLATALQLADRFHCPMHPDVIGRRAETCAKCAMALDVPARIRLQPAQGTVPRMVFATVRTDKPLAVGQEVAGALVLKTRLEEPVPIFQLREVHTKKIHLLIVDESLTDYHHEHPVPSETAGEYRFTFTPRKPGPYRVWADVQPLLTGIQEYASTEIPSADAGGEPLVKSFPMSGTHEGLGYALALDSPVVTAGEPAGARIRVTSANGKPFAALEPLMGAFAHLVGFHEDRRTVLHMHPIESRLLKPDDRGGPELAFRIFTETPGYYRLFLQVQIGGVSKFIPFGVDVVPAAS